MSISKHPSCSLCIFNLSSTHKYLQRLGKDKYLHIYLGTYAKDLYNCHCFISTLSMTKQVAIGYYEVGVPTDHTGVFCKCLTDHMFILLTFLGLVHVECVHDTVYHNNCFLQADCYLDTLDLELKQHCI